MKSFVDQFPDDGDCEFGWVSAGELVSKSKRDFPVATGQDLATLPDIIYLDDFRKSDQTDAEARASEAKLLSIIAGLKSLVEKIDGKQKKKKKWKFTVKRTPQGFIKTLKAEEI